MGGGGGGGEADNEVGWSSRVGRVVKGGREVESFPRLCGGDL